MQWYDNSPKGQGPWLFHDGEGDTVLLTTKDAAKAVWGYHLDSDIKPSVVCEYSPEFRQDWMTFLQLCETDQPDANDWFNILYSYALHGSGHDYSFGLEGRVLVFR